MVRLHVPMRYVPIAYSEIGTLTAFVLVNNVPFPVFHMDEADIQGTDRHNAMEIMGMAIATYGKLFNLNTFEVVSLTKYRKMREASKAAEDMGWIR